MSESRKDPDEIDQLILNTIKDNKPETVKILVDIVKSKSSIPEKKIIKRILALRQGNRVIIRQEDQSSITPEKYLSSTKSIWFWIIIFLVGFYSTIWLLSNKDVFLITYIKEALGYIFIFLPGYSLTKTVFPKRDLNLIEKTVLSSIISISLVILIAFILNFTFLGITSYSVAYSLILLTILLTLTALIRDYKASKIFFPQKMIGTR